MGSILLPSGLVLALSFAAMVTIGLSASLWRLMTWSIVGRIGLGFILPSLNLGAMRGLDKALIPQGSSTINFVRMLGGAAGVSLCGILLEWRLAAHGTSLTDGPPSAARLAAFDDVFLMLAALCGLAMLAARHLNQPVPPPERIA